MSKKKRITATVAAFVLFASGASYTLFKKKGNDYFRYINSVSGEEDDLLICAHRGFSSLEIENTENAIYVAANSNYVDYIEMDARMTKDGKIVLSHDQNLIDKEGNIIDINTLTYDEALSKTFIYHTIVFRTYFWNNGEDILINNRNRNLNNREYHWISLTDGIKYSSNKRIIIDLKFNDNKEAFTSELIRELDGIDTSNIIFQSLNVPAIKYVQEHSNFNCLALISFKEQLDYVDDFSMLGLNKNLVKYDLINELMKKNKKIAVWTINSSSELEMVINELGDYYKDIIYITNYPDLITRKLHDKDTGKIYIKNRI